MRFSQQYRDWFELDETLKAAVADFKEEYLPENESGFKLKNNVPSQDCSEDKPNSKNKKDIENDDGAENNANKNEVEKRERKIEYLFSSFKKNVLRTEANVNGNIYRQLPVGLFKDIVGKDNRIFSGSASAIDLWTIDGDKFCLFELKAKNPMIGAITEIFFYSNFAYDMFVSSNDENSRFELSYEKKRRGEGLYAAYTKRGYEEIVNTQIKKAAKLKSVKGFLLFDKGKDGSVHPLITADVLNVLNGITKTDSRFGKIKYDMITYDFDKING